MPEPTQHLGLLLIDLQDAFLKVIPDQKRLVNRVSFALEAAKLLGCHIAVTEQLPDKLGETTQALAARFEEDTPIFDKNSFSALEADGVDRWLESNQIDHLLIAGIESSVCIYQTAVEALSKDLGITLLSDCISERRFEDRAPVVQQLLAMEAHFLPSETIFYSLLGTALHPKFKAYTALVKQFN
ncbi:MAG: isochorismatase family protein [Verrucomicrobiota bacterium]